MRAVVVDCIARSARYSRIASFAIALGRMRSWSGRRGFDKGRDENCEWRLGVLECVHRSGVGNILDKHAVDRHAQVPFADASSVSVSTILHDLKLQPQPTVSWAHRRAEGWVHREHPRVARDVGHDWRSETVLGKTGGAAELSCYAEDPVERKSLRDAVKEEVESSDRGEGRAGVIKTEEYQL